MRSSSETRRAAAEQTIKIHRARVMEKMGAASLADLMKMSERLAPLVHSGGVRD